MTKTEIDWQYGTITDEAIARLRARLGKLDPMGPESEPFTREKIVRYINSIGDDNPLWFDEDYAAKTRWHGIVGPPTVLHAETSHEPPGFGEAPTNTDDLFPGVFAMVAGVRLVFEQPVRAGDTLRVQRGPYDVIEHKSSMARRSVELVYKSTYFNQRGEVVASNFASTMRMERDAARGNRKYLDIPAPKYSSEEIEGFHARYEAEVAQRRGGVPRYWEDIQTGESLITLLKGPLTLGTIVSFFIGRTYASLFANRLLYRHLENIPAQRLVDKESNIEDDWAVAHFTEYFARQSGIPRPYDEGIMRIGWLSHLLTDWMGDDGFLRELSASVRAPNLVGDVSWCTGRITGKRLEDERHLVDADIWITNQRGDKTTIGTAVIELPTRTTPR